MAPSSQDSVSPPQPLSEHSLRTDSSANAPGEDAVEVELLGQQRPRQHDIESDADIDVDTVDNRQEEGNHSTLTETREDSDYGDDEKGGSVVETDSVDYDDRDSETRREGVRDGSVSPSYSSLRVEPDLEDSHSHLRLEEIFEGHGSATETDLDIASLSEPFAVSELELIERALQSLQKSHKHARQEVPDSADGETDDVEVDGRSLPSPNYSRDVMGVSRLLKKVVGIGWEQTLGRVANMWRTTFQVQAVRAQNWDALVIRRRDNNQSSRPGSTSGDQDMSYADMRQVVQAATGAANSAAKAAEAVVNSMDRNSRAIEELCKTLTCAGTEGTPLKQKEGASREDNDETNSQLIKLQQSELDIELRQAEISKHLLRQNRLTHWILGFMIVSSLAWRFGVVKFVKRVNNAVSNPFQGITGVFDSFKGQKEKDGKANMGLKLPSILPGDSDDDKDGELPFNLGNLLPHTGTDTEVHASASAHTHSSEPKTDGPFNIGRIFPGRGDTADDDQ